MREGCSPSLISIPFQISAPSSSPLPGISMQHSRKEQRSDSAAVSVPRDWRCPGRTQRVTQGNEALERIRVREAPAAVRRRLWSVGCCQLKGEENKPFVCPGSSLPPLQRLPFPLLLEWGKRWGTGLLRAARVHLSGSSTKKIALRKCPKLQTAATSQWERRLGSVFTTHFVMSA